MHGAQNIEINLFVFQWTYVIELSDEETKG
jgi:hypothetical protein